MPESPDLGWLSQDAWEAMESPRQGWVDVSRYPATDPDEALSEAELARVSSALHEEPLPDLDESTWQAMLDASRYDRSGDADSDDDPSLGSDPSSDAEAWTLSETNSDDSWDLGDGGATDTDGSDEPPWG